MAKDRACVGCCGGNEGATAEEEGQLQPPWLGEWQERKMKWKCLGHRKIFWSLKNFLAN